MLRYTGRYLPIIPQEGMQLAPNLFCSRTTTPNIQPMSLGTIFSQKKNKETWKWWFGQPHQPDLNFFECATWGDRRMHTRSVIQSPNWKSVSPRQGLMYWIYERRHHPSLDYSIVFQNVWNNVPAEFLQNCVQVYLEQLKQSWLDLDVPSVHLLSILFEK